MEKFKDTKIPEDTVEYKRYVDIISGMGFRPIEIGEFYLQLEKLNSYSKNIIADCIVFHKLLAIEGPHVMPLLHSTTTCMHRLAYVLAKNDPIIFNPSQVDNLFTHITDTLASVKMDSIKIIARNNHISIESLIDNDTPIGNSIDIEFNNAAILNYIMASDNKTIQFMLFAINNIRSVIKEQEELINDLIETEKNPIIEESNVKELQNTVAEYYKYKAMLKDFDPALEAISINKFKEQIQVLDAYLNYEKSYIVKIPLTGTIATDEQRYNINMNLHRFVILSVMNNINLSDIDTLYAVHDYLYNKYNALYYDSNTAKDQELDKYTSNVVTIELDITKNLIKIHDSDEYEIPATNGNILACISENTPFMACLLETISIILTYVRRPTTEDKSQLSCDTDKPTEVTDVSNSKTTSEDYHRYKLALNAFVRNVEGMDMHHIESMSEEDFIFERICIRDSLVCNSAVHLSIPMCAPSEGEETIDMCFHRVAIMSAMDDLLDKELLSDILKKFESIFKNLESINITPRLIDIVFDKDIITVNYHMDPYSSLCTCCTWEIPTTLSYQVMCIVKDISCITCFFDAIKKIIQFFDLEAQANQESSISNIEASKTDVKDVTDGYTALKSIDEEDCMRKLFDSYMESPLISFVNTPDHLAYGWDSELHAQAISNYTALIAIGEGDLPERTIQKLFDQIMILPTSSSISSIVLRQNRSGKKASIAITIKAGAYKAMAPIELKVTCSTKKAVRLMTVIANLKTVSELYSVLNMVLDTIESDKA